MGGADQRDSKPLQLVEDQGKVGQRTRQSVQHLNDHSALFSGPELVYHGVSLWLGNLSLGLMLDEDPDFRVAFRLTKHLQLLGLGIGPWVGRECPDFGSCRSGGYEPFVL